MGLEIVPADKRGIPCVPSQEVFRLPLNDGELKLLFEMFRVAQAQNPELVNNALVDRIYTKIGFLRLLGRIMFLPADKCQQELDGLLKLHQVLAEQAASLQQFEAEARAKAQQAAKTPPPAADAGTAVGP